MLDYESAAINRYTRTFRDPELEKGYLEDRWEKNKKFIWTVVVVAHLLFIPIIGDDIKQLGPEFPTCRSHISSLTYYQRPLLGL